MKEFFTLTKAKVKATILLSLLQVSLYVFIGLSFYGSSLPDLCLPAIPYISDKPIPVLPVEPMSFSRVIAAVALLENGHILCLQNDPSAQLAYSIVNTFNGIGIILLILICNYLSICLFVFLVSLRKKQKKYKVKSKK